jgi:hypothetical protein
VSVTTPTQGLAVQLLTAIGAPSTQTNVAAMMAWLNSESTHTASTLTAMGNNPLNVSTGADVSGKVVGTTAVGPGIARYASLATGVQATAQYLQARQPGIVAGFKTGNGTAAVSAITASNYVTGGKGGNQYAGALLSRMQALLPSVTAGPNVLASAPSATAGTAIGAVQTEIATLQGYINNIQAVPSSKRNATQATELVTYTARLTAARATLASLLTTGIVTAPTPQATTSTGQTLTPTLQAALDKVAADVAAAAPTGGYPSSKVGSTDQYLGAWNNSFTLPVGHVVTAADVTTMMTALDAGGYFQNDVLGQARGKTQTILNGAIGQTWGKPLQDSLQTQLQAAGAASGDPLGIGAALGGLGSTVTTIAAYLAALVVVGLGLFLYAKGGNKEAQVAPAGY